jgi:glycine cleavage system pyridoxal-binding protein P
MGPQGLNHLSYLIRNKAHYFRTKLQNALERNGIQGVSVLPGETFNEVLVLTSPREALWVDESLTRAHERNVLAGLKVDVPNGATSVAGLAIAITERHSKEELDRLVEILVPKSHEGQP